MPILISGEKKKDAPLVVYYNDLFINHNFSGQQLLPCDKIPYLQYSPNDQNDFGNTLLHDAIYAKNLTEIEGFLKQGERCDIPDNLGITPLALLLEQQKLDPKFFTAAMHLFTQARAVNKIEHCTFHGKKMSLRKLLKNKGKNFYSILSQGFEAKDVCDVMSVMDSLFMFLDKNPIHREEGSLMMHESSDYCMHMSKKDLARMFGEIIDDVDSIVFSYSTAQKLIRKVLSGNSLSECAALLTDAPRLQTDELFQRYVTLKTIFRKDCEYWNLLFARGLHFLGASLEKLFTVAMQSNNIILAIFFIEHGFDCNMIDEKFLGLIAKHSPHYSVDRLLCSWNILKVCIASKRVLLEGDSQEEENNDMLKLLRAAQESIEKKELIIRQKRYGQS